MGYLKGDGKLCALAAINGTTNPCQNSFGR